MADSRWRILIADDEPDDRALIKTALLRGSAARSFRFAEAATVAEAVALVEAGPAFDVVLADHSLPDGNAFDLLAALPKAAEPAEGLPALPAAPIVVVTGRGEGELGARLLRAGATDFVGKDWLGPGSLSRAVENAIERHAMARELRLRQRALAESEARFRKIFEHAATGIAIVGRSGRYLRSNAAYSAITGLTEAELQEREFPALVHPAEREGSRALVRQLFAGAIPSFELESRYLRPDGTAYWVRKFVSVLDRAEGKPVELLSLVTDVTPRKRAEAEYREREATARFVAETAARLVLGNQGGNSTDEVLTATFRELARRVNADCYFHYALEAPGELQLVSLLGVDLTEHPELTRVPVGAAPVGQVVDQGQPLVLDAAGLTQTGTPVPGLRAFAGFPIAVEDRVFGLLAFGSRHREGFEPAHLDLISTLADLVAAWIDRSRLTRALKDREERLALFIAHAPAGLAMFDCEMRYLAASRRWIRDYGIDDTGLVGRNHYEVFPNLPESWREAHRRALRGEVLSSEGEAFTSPDGRELWVRWELRPWVDAQGEVGGIIIAAEDITARKRVEDALARERDLVTTIAENTTSALFMTDERGVCTYANAAAVAMTGYSAAELRATPFHDLLHHHRADGSPYPAEECPLVAARTTGAALRGHEDRFFRKDGSSFPVLYSASPITEAGKPTSMVLEVRDVTEERAVQEALRASVARARTLANAMPQLVWVANDAAEVDYYSERVREYDGTVTNPEGRLQWQPMLHPDDLATTASAWQAAVQSGTNYSCEHRLLMADGRYRWHLSRAVPVTDPTTGVRTWYGTATDIHELRETQELARQRLAELSATYDTAPIGLCVLDRDLRFVRINRRLAEINGLSMEGHLGRSVAEVLPDLLPTADRLARQVFAGEPALGVEFRGTTLAQPGVERTWVESWYPLRDADGEVIGINVVAEEVTEERRIQAELRLHREELQRLVEERTAELEASHLRLRVSERMAALGTLSAGLGHDMGNLLMPMRVRIDTLQALQLPDEVHRELEGIRASANYLQRLASGLRLLAVDPQQGTQERATEIGRWWREAEAVLRNILPRGTTLFATLPSEECWVRMAPAGLTQAIFNLVQNSADALKGMPPGAVTITIEPEGPEVTFHVSDNGPGMTPEVQQRCMEPFFTTKARGISTGLGLALVYGLVQEAGGRVELRSAPGAGTTFTLRIPRAEAPGAGAATTRRAYVDIPTPRLRAYAVAHLRHRGYEVGTEAAEEADLLVVEGAAPPGSRGYVISLPHGATFGQLKAALRGAPEALDTTMVAT